MKRTTLAATLFAVANLASAVTIDFEGLAAGVMPGNHYADLGVTFTSGVVRHNQDGAYLAAPVGVRFDAPVTGVSFDADGRTIDSYARITYADGHTEPQYIGNMSWTPVTPNRKVPGWYEGKTWTVNWSFGGITGIWFDTLALDNLRFTMPTAASAGMVADTAEVPEPATLALFGLGLFFLRRRVA